METRPIEALCADRGPHRAKDILCRALEDIGQRLFQIDAMAACGPREDLHKALRALSAVAGQIGLATLAEVARDVMRCIEDGDPVAEAATLARLARTGEASFAALCQEQDLSL